MSFDSLFILKVLCLSFSLFFLQICDFRFAKQMKGAHSFTICGDPLFFSPEIVNHQGAFFFQLHLCFCSFVHKKIVIHNATYFCALTLIHTHVGYDYSADLWAFGVLCYEMCEENTPFGDSSTDETAIFKKVSAIHHWLFSYVICMKWFVTEAECPILVVLNQ